MALELAFHVHTFETELGSIHLLANTADPSSDIEIIWPVAIKAHQRGFYRNTVIIPWLQEHMRVCG